MKHQVFPSDKAFKKQLGLFLKKKRVSAGLTQRNVARHFDFTTAQYISLWERGVSAPSLIALKELVRLYEMDREEVISLFESNLHRILRSSVDE